MQSRQGGAGGAGGAQLSSLQEELDRLREELQEGSAQRKRMEEEHGKEKTGLQLVRMGTEDRWGGEDWF